MTHASDEATRQTWTALGGAAEATAPVSFRSAGDTLPARLPVRQLARATVAACSLAAARLLAQRNATAVPPVEIDEGAVATAFTSERHLRVDGRAPVGFAPLSGFWRTADGWVRIHANYPHHRARLLTALGIADPGEGDDARLAPVLAAAVEALPSDAVQEAVYGAGGLAVAVAPRPMVRRLPLLESRASGGRTERRLEPAALPAAGVRVLDLTRVIAGPVATRTLALLGADVLRVDAPQLPEDPDSHTDTGFGKRSTLLDLTTDPGRATFDRLLAEADVVVTGYRPGALERHGLAPERLAARRPGVIVAQLSAWGWGAPDPWADRRGFDSLVQAATGIAAVETTSDGGLGAQGPRPGALPAQALDHSTGYLLAAAVLRAITARQSDGTGRLLRLSLTGTASWLLHALPASPEPSATAGEDSAPYDPRPWLAERASPYGWLTYARPPVAYEGAPTDWSSAPTRWGADPARWL